MAACPALDTASNSLSSQPIIHFLTIIIALLATTVNAEFANGCALYNELCEENEICVPDGLFGECTVSEEEALVIPEPLDQTSTELIRSQLEQLDQHGYGLEDARTQCLIIYFKLASSLQLNYDPDFCDVSSPENVWKMLQSVKMAVVENAPMLENVNSEDGLGGLIRQQHQQHRAYADNEHNSGIVVDHYNIAMKQDTGAPVLPGNILADESIPVSENLITPVVKNPGEEEEEQSVNFVDSQAPVLKKDIEHLGDQNTGLENIEHKIVKGTPPFQKVDGSRVYLRVAEGLSEEQLYQLIDFLDHSIALPNKLVFSDFQLDGDQLSFRAGRSSVAHSRNEKRLDSVESIAEAVYKRRKDIQTLSGVRVDETGIGSGEEAVPVESENRDRFFTPILVVSAFTIAALVTVMAAHQIKEHRGKKRGSGLPEIGAEQYGGKTSLVYQDLCRHQMRSHDPTSATEPHSKHSSASSWVEEPISQSNLDISTGHVILSFLRDYLDEDTSKMEGEWKALEGYKNPNGISSVAEKEENMAKNRDATCLPYDDSLVSVQSAVSSLAVSTYINASAIHDSDPKQANYIATQWPLPNTVVDFWQMIWEQGTVLIVNLANDEDQRKQCARYWPESGSQVHGSFEIHLVSEHIWSEDYLVRSFYLKNLKTNETRTVTQFHFLTWHRKGVPSSSKALLDFRRKINKSYRGRAAPIVVHSIYGTGRTGTYCLLDMVLNRVSRGVKELNVAGSLEHLRDQRPGMVETSEQYKMVFICLAEEITAVVAALPR